MCGRERERGEGREGDGDTGLRNQEVYIYICS